MSRTPIAAIVAGLWRLAGLDPAALSLLRLSGAEPVLPSSFRVDALAQATIAASGLAAAELHALRGAARQPVAVDLAHAAAEFRSERHLRVDGNALPELWDRIAGAYRCGDRRWVRLHTNFPHHRDGVLRILGCAHDRSAVAAALQGWPAERFEAAAGDAGMVVAMMRTADQWHAHPQATALEALPLFTIERIGDGAPNRRPPGGRPLAGVRALDLTRVIAGPVCGRTLAAHGADVMLVSAAHLPSIEPLVMDTGRGKLSTRIDLRDGDGRAQLRSLAAAADLFVQGYRPGALAVHGFSAQELARIRPGIVVVSLSAYGHAGPWAGRRGFDSLVQTATGFNHAEAAAAGGETPRPLPCQALDHGSGYLMALGALAALMRQMREGGSWHVRVSLAQTGRWLAGLGRLDNGIAARDPGFGDVQPWLEDAVSGFGRLTAVRHAARLEATPAYWQRPSVPLGTHPPQWPEGGA
jgi:crotonobetainyl-CoA:carnitine CoA-transferase CaiB-like acyl-CoA transferase